MSGPHPGALRVALSAVGRLVVAAVGSMTRNRGSATGWVAGPSIPPCRADEGIAELVRQHTPDGVRRAIPLAIGMFVYRRTLNHDSLGVFLAAFAGPLLLLALTASTVAA
jgi:hypothetical protein